MDEFDLSQSNPTKRFLTRVLDYEKHRPDYPEEIVNILINECQIGGLVVADVGSGTGKFTSILLKAAKQVISIEPNSEMRDVIQYKFRSIPNFCSIDGTAERIPLTDSFVDMVTVAQAFHWFDKIKAKREFNRVLKPEGWVVLVWNNRNIVSPFEIAYEELIGKYASPYPYKKPDRTFLKEIETFYHPHGYVLYQLNNQQELDYSGIIGRILSSSFIPNNDERMLQHLEQDARALFSNYQEFGLVRLTYSTVLYIGKVA